MNSNQIITVWGNPSSGKTITSIKLAKQLSLKNKNVILVFSDLISPTLMTILPDKNTENKSIGSLLSSPEITQDTILSQCITLNKNNYISFLGYSQSENIFSYAEYSKERVVDFLILLRHLADYVIIDCSSNFAYDTLSAVALEMADSVVRLCNSNLKAMSYFKSYLPLLADKKFNIDKHIKILSNVKDNEPTDQIKEVYKGVKYQLPYIEEIENQFLTGELLNELKIKNNNEYNDAIKKLLSTITGENINEKKKHKEREISFIKKISLIGKGGGI